MQCTERITLSYLGCPGLTLSQFGVPSTSDIRQIYIYYAYIYIQFFQLNMHTLQNPAYKISPPMNISSSFVLDNNITGLTSKKPGHLYTLILRNQTYMITCTHQSGLPLAILIAKVDSNHSTPKTEEHNMILFITESYSVVSSERIVIVNIPTFSRAYRPCPELLPQVVLG